MNDVERIADAWEPLLQVHPETLVEAREALHWAAQILGAVGNSLVDPQPDDGHTTLVWDAALRGLVTDPQPGFQVALLPGPMTLQLRGGDGSVASSLALDGHTLDDTFAWLERAIAELTGAPPARAIERREYDLPPHPVAAGAPFVAGDAAPRRELARWYAAAAQVLEVVRAGHEGASPVRLWPHHFDMATSITLDPGEEGEATRSVGVGMSPGDGGTKEPYWYVTPWPYPDADALPQLGGEGLWHTEGWVGAVLPASRLVDAGATSQARQVTDFTGSAVAAALRLLGGE